MAEDKKLQYSAMIKPAMITVLAYAVVKLAYYAAFFDKNYVVPRLIASLVMASLAFVFFVPNMPRRHMSWIVPVGMVLTELAVIQFVEYDRLVYFFLVGCALLSLLLIDLTGLLVTVWVSWIAVSIHLFVLNRSLIGGSVMEDDAFYFAGVVAVDIMIVLMCKYSAGVLEKTRHDIEAALGEAQEANRVKSRFLVAMSHEIRTPMNAITGMAELALHEDMPDAARKRIRTIKQTAGNLLSAVDSIFDPSKIDGVTMEDVGAGAAPPHAAPEVTAPHFCAPDARILVVDDIKTNLEVARGLLSLYKMQVDTRVSGAEAIEAIKDNRYDMIFMDHMMPEVDGIEITKRIRELGESDPRFKGTPIIALTANAVTGAREMFLRNGFNGFLSKPVDTAELAEILEKWIADEKKKPVLEETDVISDAAMSDIVIDGVDVQLGIARTGGTLNAYFKTLEIFSGDGREKIGELKKCIASDNLQLYTTYIHALKSAAANIGAVRLSEAAKVLEAAGKRNDRAFINKHTSRVLADLVVILRGVDRAVAARKEMLGEQPGDVDAGALKETLTKLKAAIDAVDPAGINAAVKELEPFENANDENLRAKIKAVAQTVLNGDYDAAAVIIDSLL